MMHNLLTTQKSLTSDSFKDNLSTLSQQSMCSQLIGCLEFCHVVSVKRGIFTKSRVSLPRTSTDLMRVISKLSSHLTQTSAVTEWKLQSSTRENKLLYGHLNVEVHRKTCGLQNRWWMKRAHGSDVSHMRRLFSAVHAVQGATH